MIYKIYRPLVPPFEMKPFEEMTTKEAKRFFNWYIQEIPNRLEQLMDSFELTGGGSRDILDFTPQSLKPLWAWFIPQVKLVPRSEEDIEREVARSPDWLKESIRQDKHSLSPLTLSVAFDIGIYFAETFIKNTKGINWGFFNKPKLRIGVNKPVLLGFDNKVDLCPSRILNVLTLEVTQKQINPNALYDVYNVWKEKLIKSE